MCLVDNLHKDETLIQDEYAIKTLTGANAKNGQMIVNEACLISFLDSEELIKCFGIFKHNNRYITLLEYMNGGHFKEIIRVYNEKYSEDFCRYTIYKVAKGIFKMHNKQVLHRDIKSENILCSDTGEIKIADLGLS